ncbi:spore coat protein [Paenibacillus sedimenti]|uniref:Spore coat protein n=1 Tax=Paenibacillus sedimenti TaxID=2770274 RepID=A0A926KU79_9BACL|nr:spore coat protein [Paenibacillus sedimenti]MBD0384120.1 spore coat protein [Paenibacillus sedimenti]
MYQQNYQQQGYGAQPQVYLQEQDLANFVLSELKRTAREYTTATLEAANPQIRQAFQTLLQKTLQDQAAVFQEIQKLGGYDTQPAAQEQLQQELQKQNQSAAKLQSFVQQNLSRAGSAGGYQQQPNQAMTQQQFQPSQSQNQIAAPQQTSFQPAPTISSSAYPNAVYSQGIQQSVHNIHNQQQPYSGMQGQSYQDQSYGQTQSYSPPGLTSSEITGLTGKSSNQGTAARSQTSSHSPSTSEGTYSSRQNEGSKYSF